MSPINLDQADLDFAAELSRRPGGAGISKCYACGACSAVCPVMAFKEDYDPRRLIRLILLGQKETVLRNPLIWFCAACYSCQEVCPQQVDFTELSFALRNWAVDEGAGPPALVGQIGLLSQQGRLYAIDEFAAEKRTKQGLPAVEEQPADYDKLLGDLRARLTKGGEGDA